MSKPRHGPPKVQVTAYILAGLKERLAARAAADKKRERDVLEAALESYLAPSPEPAPADPA